MREREVVIEFMVSQAPLWTYNKHSRVRQGQWLTEAESTEGWEHVWDRMREGELFPGFYCQRSYSNIKLLNKYLVGS